MFRPQLPQSQNEAPPQVSRSGFPSYDSPLARYPLLRPRFGPNTSAGNASLVASQSEITTIAPQASARRSSPASVHFPCLDSCATGAVSSHPCSPIPLPDLKGLKHAVLHRSLAQLTRRSPDLRVCPYEVPGGGVCRDRDCGELHLGRIGKEPSGTLSGCFMCGLTGVSLPGLQMRRLRHTCTGSFHGRGTDGVTYGPSRLRSRVFDFVEAPQMLTAVSGKRLEDLVYR